MTVRIEVRRCLSIALASMTIASFVDPLPYVLSQDKVEQSQPPNSSQKKETQISEQPSNKTSQDKRTRHQPNDRADDEAPALGVLAGSCPGKAVCVKGTIPYSPADEAGIEIGDYILSVDGKEVSSPSALKKLIASMSPDAQVTLKVWRQGEEMELKAQLASQAEQLPKGHDAWLGVMLATDEKGGVKIDHIVPGSPASESDLEEGDMLVKVKNADVKDAQSFIEKIEEMGPGDKLALTIRRDGEEREMSVLLGSFSDAPMAFLRHLQSEHDNSFHSGEPHGGSNSTQLIDRALDDIRKQLRTLRNEIRELKGDKSDKPANAPKEKVSAVSNTSGVKFVSQIQFGPQAGNLRPYFNGGTIPRSYGQYNYGYNQRYSPYYGNNYGNGYGNNYGNGYGNSYYYRYGGRPYYYGGNSNWYGNRPRAGIQVGPNAGVYWY